MNDTVRTIVINILNLTTRPDTLAIPTGTGVRETGDLGGFVGGLVLWTLGLIGIVLFILILAGGIQYATAGGDESKTKAAITQITNAIIGLILVGLTFVVANTVLTATLGTTP